MNLAEKILYNLSKRAKSPVANRDQILGTDAGSESYHTNYAIKLQYDGKVRRGMGVDIRDKTTLEIGCGHGGITIFCAMNGAKKAIGVDIDDRRLAAADRAAAFICQETHRTRESLPAEFRKLDVYKMDLPDNSIDIILADNVFEHFMQLEKVLEQCFRVLKPGGEIVVSSMPSFYAKNGAHLKNGLKVPWSNVFFSEKTICNVMMKLAEENPNLLEIYPGLKNKPQKIKDIRASGDLNSITYGRFKRMAINAGFKLKNFSVHPNPRILGLFFLRIPVLKNSILMDVLSTTASANLQKPKQ